MVTVKNPYLQQNTDGSYVKSIDDIQNDVVNNLLNRNDNISNLLSSMRLKISERQASRELLPYIQTPVEELMADDKKYLIDRETMKPVDEEGQKELADKYSVYESPSKYLLGTQQLVNKMASKGVLSNVLPSSIVDRATKAYSENEDLLNNIHNYNATRGHGEKLLNLSESAPEIGSELAAAIPVAGQIGKISAIANLVNKGKLGSIAAEGLKWGGAEVPASYLLGNQDHLGERVAMGIAGGVVGEGLIQGGKALFKKAGELKEKIPVGKTLDDVKAGEYEPRVNTPESTQVQPEMDTVKPEVFPDYHNFDSTVGSSKQKNDNFNKMYNTGDFHVLKDETIQGEMDRIEIEANKIKDKIELAKANGNRTEGLDNLLDRYRNQYGKLNGILKERKTPNNEPVDESTMLGSYNATKEAKFNTATKDDEYINSKVDEFFRQRNDGAVPSITSEEYQTVKKEFTDRYHTQKNANTASAIPEGSTINEMPKEGTNTPEVPVDEIKPIAEPNINTVDGSGGATAPQAEVKKKLTTKEINKGIADTIDAGTDYLVGSVKKMLQEPHIKALVDSGLDIGKAAKETVSEMLNKNKITKLVKDDLLERFNMEGESATSFMNNLTSDLDTSLRGKMFNRATAIGKKGETESIQVGDFVRANSKQLMKDMPEGGEPLRKAFTKHYLHTDFQAIDKTVKSFDDVVNYLKENKDLYTKFKKEIDQAALALKDKKAMESKNYYNNAEAIAKTKGVKDPDVIEKIDKLISMKSLTKEDLDFVLKNRGQSWFDDLAEKTQEASSLSKSLFEKDPHNYMKGYYKEIYGKDIYSHDFDINGKDNKTWKFLERPEYVKGALPINAIKKPIGAEVTTARAINSADASTRAEALDALRSAGEVRTVRDSQGKPVSYHKVLSEERRAKELNKNYDAADILASTYQSILKKQGVKDLVEYIQKETGDTFISYKPKDGFVKIPQSEAVLLPKELRGEFKDGMYSVYLPKDLRHQLIGNQAIGYTEKASLINGFHRFMTDASSHFKHNVIITSLRSYFVNEVGGWTAALRQGMGIGEIRGYLKELEGQTKQMRQLQNQYFQALTTGKDVTKLEAKLRSIPLVQMRDEGLSLTMIHDYMAHSGNRSVSHDLVETGLEKIYKLLGKEKKHPLEFKDKMQLEDGTYGGEVASLVMSNIDARWRYVITKGLMDKKGHTMTEAVNLANSIFGNANKITPRIVQYADNMLLVPFGSWMFRVLAGNIKANKDNMAQALGIYTTMKALSAGSGYNLNSGDSTQIPLSPMNAMGRMGVGSMVKAANPFHEPLYVDQLLKAGSSQNPLDAILTPNR